MLSLLEKRRYRAVWSDPARKLRTLESFAETEADGGHDLEVAARRVQDGDLREHLLRHARDERRHADMFLEAAERHRQRTGLGARGADEADRAYDLSRGRKDEVDAHGFFKAGLIDELGEVSYIAMVHVAEQKAAKIFALHRSLVDDDPELAAAFDQILKDEKYHCAYTEKFLDKWRGVGREKEVNAGLKSARSSRFIGAWRRLGLRSGSRFSQFMLFVMYWTVLLPFGALARLGKPKPAVRELSQSNARERLSSQY
ncbi:ferritin-like domain-containing protein [Engelhardtia mirabilis]|uniref:Uncharacterized protein n=1 Tax=Engelhardtia mirabilis TaxID=2528011 RepID=A0A518BKG7_9BACT|nr:hypothetical protein Pla133_25600 [Planctomycetes bacterium Pla133]QDV01803.1 hypothetical protein Pla86_25590 [Planctomycetes bacterium Pla86]